VTLLLGIDIGTTATKAILLDTALGLVAERERPTALFADRPGWAEEDVAAWWANVVALCRDLGDGRSIDAVGVSGMVPCVVLQDGDGNPIRRSIQQNDARAEVEIAELRSRLAGARVLERTGSAITQQSVGPTLMWLQHWEPENWSRARTIAGSYDTVVRLLTGERSVESNWALESGLFDLEVGGWGTDILDAVGLSPELLPPVRRPDEVVGGIAAQVARVTGLREGTPVVAGSADHVASAFAAGLAREGDLLVKLGGAGDILMTTAEPVIDERLYLDYHLVPGLFLPNGCMATSGSFIRWFQQTLAGGESLARLDEEAAAAGPGAGGVVALPYMLGEKTPIHDPAARGAFIGMTLATERGHLFRAVLEGISFGFRHHLDVFADLGHVPRRVRVTNGGARSRLWKQVTADVLGLPLETLRSHPGSALGAAFAAGMGTGAFADWGEIDRFVEVGDVVVPHDHDLYERPYRTFRSLYPALKELRS
jgi:xylulokinase